MFPEGRVMPSQSPIGHKKALSIYEILATIKASLLHYNDVLKKKLLVTEKPTSISNLTVVLG